jgi:hypothetical protein
MSHVIADHLPPLTPSENRYVLSRNLAVSSLLLLLGTALNVFAYRSIQPIGACLLFYVAGAAFLYVTPRGLELERKAFRVVFAVGWFMAGVAAYYANYLDDSFQNTSDAASFFELAVQPSEQATLANLKAITEGSGAVLLWRSIYDFFALLGFDKERYIGVLLNVTAAAETAVIAVRMSRLTFGHDVARINRLILLFAACGIFWIFEGIHLRDAVVLLGVTALGYCWVRYLARPRPFNLLLLIAGTLLGFLFFGFLRAEFVFVPAALLVAGVVSILLFDPSKGARKLILYVVAAAAAVVAAILYLRFSDEVLLAIEMGNKGYFDEVTQTSSADSLGARFIVAAPLPVRLLFGSAYLFVFPIPVWSGFQLESAYHLFKSCHAIFFYAVTPLFALTLLRIAGRRALRTPVVMFLLFSVFGFLVAIAGTSLESRHFGSFMPLLFLLVTLPDLTATRDRRAFRGLLLAFLGLMTLVHLAWASLKFA